MERTRIIIADDESLIRMDLREMLTNLGYLVVGEVGDGRSAVNLARELRPDIVIMDIKMPVMDGLEATRRIREFAGEPKHVVAGVGADQSVQERKIPPHQGLQDRARVGAVDPVQLRIRVGSVHQTRGPKP